MLVKPCGFAGTEAFEKQIQGADFPGRLSSRRRLIATFSQAGGSASKNPMPD
jgi:hypothetical protein